MWSRATRLTVLGSAFLAVLLRFQGLFEPLHPDEAGFLLVARTWHPTPTSLYGQYFVDRPPPLIALFKLSDAIGGPYFIRVLGALSCFVLVLLAARTAWEVTRTPRAVTLAAITAAALVGFAGIDPAATKGELLGIPWVLGACLLALMALRGDSARLALAAGFVAMVPVGLKQNLVGGLVFGGLVLLGSAVARRLPWRRFAALGGSAIAGAAIPVLLTIGWTVTAGVHLHELWYATFGFRVDANDVIAHGPTADNQARLGQLALLALGAGMFTILVLFLATVRQQWRRDRVLVVATTAMLAMDVAGVVLGGSYWTPYLFNPIPSLVLALIGVIAAGGTVGRLGRATVVWPVVATVVSVVVLLVQMVQHPRPDVPYYTGLAIKQVSQPGDTIVVYGGNSQLVYASGLHDPYYLWSLPTRVLDPHLRQLSALVTGPTPPTWLLLDTGLRAWGIREGAQVEALVRQRYVHLGRICTVDTWRLRSADRSTPAIPCKGLWHVW